MNDNLIGKIILFKSKEKKSQVMYKGKEKIVILHLWKFRFTVLHDLKVNNKNFHTKQT